MGKTLKNVAGNEIQTMTIEVNIVKMTDEAALVEGVARAEDTIVTRGKLSFARITV